MIKLILTIDYEIYGNGKGSLRELVYEPMERLRAIFQKWDAHLVVFVEAAELEVIERHQTDDASEDVRRQIAGLYRQGHEVGLHLHPQWYNARHDDGKWVLDYGEYNLCTLHRERIAQIIEQSIKYLRNVLDKSDFTPLSFRAGNWLLQPTKTVTSVLLENGIKIDSSVFKGGLQRQRGMDYRPACKNGFYWRFQEDVNVQDPDGQMIEVPTYSEMVPSWKMVNSKRMQRQKRGLSSAENSRLDFKRFFDLMRLRYPFKLDYCRMTKNELTCMMDNVLRADKTAPAVFRPIVAIGHSKDLDDFDTVEFFISYLKENGVSLSTFEDIYPRFI